MIIHVRGEEIFELTSAGASIQSPLFSHRLAKANDTNFVAQFLAGHDKDILWLNSDLSIRVRLLAKDLAEKFQCSMFHVQWLLGNTEASEREYYNTHRE